MKKNAIILAAGKSSRFAPFTYERPKGLFRVKGQILIERQIEQLIEAGIENIYVVIGYMKEKFFYLEQKYSQVTLLINNKFGMKGNLYSLFVAKDYLCNSYISYADYYFVNNPFVNDLTDKSYHSCIYINKKFKEFSVTSSDANVITQINIGGNNQLAMIGHAFLTDSFAKRFVSFMESEIEDFRVSSLFWEEFFAKHIYELTLSVKEMPYDEIQEFNSIENLCQFDSDFLYNVDSDIINNICETLRCNPINITDIKVINAGLTNVSFSFYIDGIQYVYRHPGGTAGNLINRSSEIYAQNKALEIGIDQSVIAINQEGWKISYCVQNLGDCDFRKYPQQMCVAMDFLRKLHNVDINQASTVKNFDNVEEGLRLIKLASLTKGNLLDYFSKEINKIKQLDRYLKEDAERLGLKRCLCHNDVYEPNFLATKSGELYLIDWEYAGINDPANDICGLFGRYDYTETEIEIIIKEYLGTNYSEDLFRHFYAFIPITAFYFMAWGCYKGSVGEDDGFFFLPCYKNIHRFIDKALSFFEQNNN